MKVTTRIAADLGIDRITHILDGLRNALVAVLVTLSVVTPMSITANVSLLKGMREALAANTRSKVAFTCSPEDNSALTRKTTPLSDGSSDRADAVKALSSTVYGRDRDSVEEEIWDRQRLAKTRLLPDLTEHPNPPGRIGGRIRGRIGGRFRGRLMKRPPPDGQIAWSEGAEGGRIGTQTRYLTRIVSRSRSSASFLDSASGSTHRDLELCLDLYEHRVLTTQHIFELRFPSLRRAQRRLLVLQQRGIVERFRPFRFDGSHPWHYIVGEVGMEMVASWRGVERKELGLRMDRLRRIAYSPRLAHVVEVNGFFSRLAYRCRITHLVQVKEWWSERRCAAEWRGMVRPDGLGLLQGAGVDVRFFLELDRGTENSSRLEEKLVRYARVARFADAPQALLFVFPTVHREAEARRALFNCGMPLLTGTRGFVGKRSPLPLLAPDGRRAPHPNR
jgi:hypothetical protein